MKFFNLFLSRSALLVLVCLLLFGVPAQSQVTFLEHYPETDIVERVVSIEFYEGKLYVLSQQDAEYIDGFLYRMNTDGSEREILHVFGAEVRYPRHFKLHKGILYGSAEGTVSRLSAFFQYHIEEDKFEVITDLPRWQSWTSLVGHITDSLIWGLSDYSLEDEGSLFTLSLDKKEFEKVYNQTGLDRGQDPVAMLHLDSLFLVAFYRGGGIPLPDEEGVFAGTGCIARMNPDGSDYQVILQGAPGFGAHPLDLFYQEGKIYTVFYDKGRAGPGHIVRFNLDGSEVVSLGTTQQLAVSGFKPVGNNLYGVSRNSLYRVDLAADTALDVFTFGGFPGDVADVFLVDAFCAVSDREFYFSASKGGDYDKGGFFKIIVNTPPSVWGNPGHLVYWDGFEQDAVDLTPYFTDDDLDELVYEAIPDKAGIISFRYAGDTLLLQEEGLGQTWVTVKATDPFGASNQMRFKVTVTDGKTGFEEPEPFLSVYPNPAKKQVFLELELLSSFSSFSLFDSRGQKQFTGEIRSHRTQVDLSRFTPGLYLLEVKGDQVVHRTLIIE
ncbi:MAG TPA: hypothetical protein DCE41_27725 [Cytophagales bacterium]|nr:hypothetical protein [Cytophagales bacterium]HAA21353.1 hypothetical protein [Cytophagales bacterium]HAP58090.1 hypothetical protein [Cytophagales bacterium]